MRHRRLLHLVGPPEDTAARAADAVSALEPSEVWWVGVDPPPGVSPTPVHTLRQQLGRSADAVVLDLHDGLDADRLAAAHGFVRGGGILVLRWSVEPPAPPRLRLPPWPATAVGRRLERRVRAPHEVPDHAPSARVPRPTTGTTAQAEGVRRLRSLLRGGPCIAALTARRGRGKSTAVGMALAAHLRDHPDAVARLTGPHERAVGVVRQQVALPYTDPLDLLDEPRVDVLAIDEAAALSVPLVRQLVARHPHAVVLLSTTVGGYEGTGNGFALRLLASLEGGPRPVHRLTLDPPIRWDPDDPLEAWLDQRLLLGDDPLAAPAEGAVACRHVPADELAADEGLLHEVFGLLRHAHYRTTPADLHRMLDGPNLDVHVAQVGDRVAGVCLTAREGSLDEALVARMATGGARVRGHALADTLVCHGRQEEAGRWQLLRSVRIATHPELRRRGVARSLVDHVHRHAPDADLVGTLFGATRGLLRFRRACGYRLVRLGASRGSRTGVPAAVMVWPRSERARAMTDRLQQQLARDLPLQLRLLHGDGELPLPEGLADELAAGLPPVTPYTPALARPLLHAYVQRAVPFEVAASAVRWWRRAGARAVGAADETLLDARLEQGRSWVGLARDLGYPSVKEAMRAMRRAVAAMGLPEPDDDRG
jgi:tRNA(Met) cytidine acetyltransferase